MIRSSAVLFAALVLVSPTLQGQASVDPSGHWEGSVAVPDHPVRVEVDVTRNAKGLLVGTINHPAQGVKGLPVASVAVEGRTIRIVVKASADGGTFVGTVAADGKSISGTYNTADGGYSIPFTLTRTGEAVVEGPPQSPAVSKEFEGAWNGALKVGERQMRLVLTIANGTDGTSTGTLLSVDATGVEFPVGLEQKGDSLTVTVKLAGGTFAGRRSAGELIGTWTQPGFTAPLTFRRQF